MKKTGLLILTLFLSTLVSLAQFGFEFDPSIPVIGAGDYMDNPWGGGFNFTQVSDFDYDFDGDMDLFMFDRSSNNIRVLIRKDTVSGPYYETDYYAKENFPTDLRYRATMVDYDNDGRKDIFTYGLNGLKVYRNVGDVVNGIQWQLVSELLYSQYPGSYTNITASGNDIPAIVDVDFDGDIDVLTFHQGGQHVEYHQNQSMDLYGVPDSLIFILMNECWGKFSEDPNNNAVILNDPNSPCVGGNIPNPQKQSGMHSGSTLLALDIDNSGVLDLVIGDVSYTNLILLVNGGTAPNTDSPMISQDPFFPSNTTPVDLQVFPAGYYVDVDFDGVKDLVVGVNAEINAHNETSIWYYKNLGSNELPNFIYIENNYFQKEMIEHGKGSIPVFFDYDEDGFEDLIVANYSRFVTVGQEESTLALYRNTGTSTDPEFRYTDYNYLDLPVQNYGRRSVPTFSDLDGDGDKDMLLGIEDGTIVFYENSSIGGGAVFTAGIPNYEDVTNTPIDVGNFAHPQLFDVDNDGLTDLLIGNKLGEISFYKNVGDLATPLFELMDNTFGSVDVSTASPDGYASPHFFRHNTETKLFIGNRDGSLYYFDSIDVNLGISDTFALIATDYAGINVEELSSFALNDIDNDGSYNLFVGQELGGLFHFNANPNSSIGLNELNQDIKVAIFPNPFDSEVQIIADNILHLVAVFDALGKQVYSQDLSTKTHTLNLSDLKNGLYLLKVTDTAGNSTTKRIVKNG